ncbi:MAG: LysR family transcriptional regulator [Psychrobium sp.]
MNNDLNQIRIFQQVAELASFTKAADALGIEKSTVSTKINHLETRLGIRLLQRTTRSVSLTEAGQQYLEYCQRALHALKEGDDYIAELSDVPSGLLRISTPHRLVEFTMESIFSPFLKQNPNVQLEIHESNEKVDLISEKFDLAIRSSFENIDDSSLIYRKLFSREWVLVASTEFIAQYGRPKDISELKQLPSVGTTALGDSQSNSDKFSWRGHKVKLRHRLTVNNIIAVKKAMLNHIGIAIMPYTMIKQEIEDQQAAILLDDAEIEKTSLYMIYPSRSGQPAKLKALVNSLIEWAETLK